MGLFLYMLIVRYNKK